MLSTYGSILNQFATSTVTIAAASGGTTTVGGSYDFFIQGRNRAGRNLLSSAIAVSWTVGQKIDITINSAVRTTGGDLFRVIISAVESSDGSPNNATILAEVELKDASQTVDEVLPTTISLTTDGHLELDNLIVADAVSLPATPVNGQRRFVTSDSKWYRYDARADEWEVSTLGSGAYLSSTTALGGCDRPLNDLGSNIILSPPDYPGDNSEGAPVQLWLNNAFGGANVLQQGTTLSFQISVNNETDTKTGTWDVIFYDRLEWRFLGVVTVATGAINATIQSAFAPWDGSFFAPVDINPGEALAVEVRLKFNLSELQNILPDNASIGINFVALGLRGDEFPAGYFTGSSVSKGELMRVLPTTTGLTIKSGLVIVVPTDGQTPFISPLRSEQFITGLQSDTAGQKVTLNAALGGRVLVRQPSESLLVNEGLRAIVSTAFGTNPVSAWSSPLVVAAGDAIALTLTYPTAIEANYPDVIAGAIATFNAPQIKVWLRVDGGTIYELAGLNVTEGEPSDSFTIADLASATTVASLPPNPAANFGLFDNPTPNSSVANGGGSLAAGSYEIAIAAHYPSPNTDVTSISHQEADGCLPELSQSLSDILGSSDYWGDPVNTVTALKALTPVPNQIRRVGETNLIYRYDSGSLATGNDRRVIVPDSGTGRWLALNDNDRRWVADIAALKAVIDADDRSVWVVGSVGADYGLVFYTYQADSTTTAFEPLLIEPTSGIGRYHAIKLDRIVATSDPTGTPPYPGVSWYRKDSGLVWQWNGTAWVLQSEAIAIADLTALIALSPADGQRFVVADTGTNYPKHAIYTFVLGGTNPAYSPVCIANTGATGQFITQDIDTIIEATAPSSSGPRLGIKHLNTTTSTFTFWDGLNWVGVGGGEGNTAPTLSYKGQRDNSIPIRFWYKGTGSTYSVSATLNGGSLSNFSGTNASWQLYSGSTTDDGEIAIAFTFSRTALANPTNDDYFQIGYLQIGDVFFENVSLSEYGQNDTENPWTQAKDNPIIESPETVAPDGSSTLTLIANPEGYQHVYRESPGALVSGSFQYQASSNASDILRVFANGVNVASTSGDSSWLSSFLSLPVGINEIVFEYARITATGSSGDYGQIRNLTIGNLTVDFTSTSSDRGFRLADSAYDFVSHYDLGSDSYWLRSASLPSTNSDNLVYVSHLVLRVEVTPDGGVQTLSFAENTTLPTTGFNTLTLRNINNALWVRPESNGLPFRVEGAEITKGIQTERETTSTVTCGYQYKGTTNNNSYTCDYWIDGQSRQTFSGTNANFLSQANWLSPGIHTFAWVYTRSNTVDNLDKFEIKALDFGDISFTPDTNTLLAPGVNHLNWQYDSTNKTLHPSQSLAEGEVAALVIRVEVRPRKARLIQLADVAQPKSTASFGGSFQYIADTVSFQNLLQVYLYNSESSSLVLTNSGNATWQTANISLYPGINVLRFEYDKAVAAGADGDVCKVADFKFGDNIQYTIASVTGQGWVRPASNAWTTEIGTLPDGTTGNYLRSPAFHPVGATSWIEYQFYCNPFNKGDVAIALDDTQVSIYPNAHHSDKFTLNVSQNCTLYTPNNVYEGYEMTILVTYTGAFTLSLSGYNMGSATLTPNTTTLLKFAYLSGALYLISLREF